MYFDAHSDIWTDVTVKREHGEKNVLKNHHLDRLRAGQVEGSIFVIWVERPDIQDYAIRTAQIKQAILDETAECDDVQIVHTVAEMKQARDAGKFYIWIGIERIVWMPKDLKDQVSERLNKTAKELYGIDNFCDMVGDETIATDPETLLAFLTEKGHPALGMDPMM